MELKNKLMFCEHCGGKIEKGASFCPHCGRKLVSVSESKPKSDIDQFTEKEVFYSEDWRRKNIFALVSLPYYDLMSDKKYLYVIEMPKYRGSTWGAILGLIIFNIIGAFIGFSIGGSKDAKKRKWYRAGWITPEHRLISNDYIGSIFLKIPLENLKENIVMGKNKFTLNYEGKKIVLGRIRPSFTLNKPSIEFERFNNYIQKYVL